MIRPPGLTGVAFSDGGDGDIRNDPAARARLASALDISEAWATVRQVHGNDVIRVDIPGPASDADALWTTERDLPVAIFTADCFGVVMRGDDAVGVAHAGWRGAAAGVVAKLRAAMTSAGHGPTHAAVGPGIGRCCFEVGEEVASQFEGFTTTTAWGASSVDLPAVLGRQLEGMGTSVVGKCTFHDEGWFSHRKNGTLQRLAAVGWVP